MGSITHLSSRLVALLTEVRRLPGCAPVGRLSVALYDQRRDVLRAYAQTSDTLDRYEIGLAEVPSLAILAAGDEPRVVLDLATYGRHSSPHTAALREAGYRSSLTVPVRHRGEFVGFIFFNADAPGVFTPQVVALLAPFANAIAEMTLREVAV